MKISLLFLILFTISGSELQSDDKGKFSKEEILRLTDAYVENNLRIKNPAIVDVDGDGDFDILKFNDGKVMYFENKGSLEKPEFVLKNENFDSYKPAVMLAEGMPLPVFFADEDGDGDMDLFAVKNAGYNETAKTTNYRILTAQNHIDIDTGTLITIILVLVIVLLILAIVR